MTTFAVSTVHDTDPESLYERVGADPAIQAVMGGLYARIMGDPELAPIFERVNIERHSRKAAAFVAAAAGGPDEWSGRDMASAHRNLQITNEQFDRVAEHLNDTLEAMEVPLGLTTELLILVGSLRSQIVTEPVA
jgi:truncated hemoglobin YjbI